MELLHIAFAAYIATTLFALMMTYKEQRSQGYFTPGFALLGYCSCLIWPAVGACMVFCHRAALHKANQI